jgi:NAD(P)-dependent dehydrogenase (short-subunit alcohol dehydrogenase family)
LINYCRPCLAHDFVLGIRASRTTDCADNISLDDQRITQRTVKEMLKQKSGCVVSITAALAVRPIAGVNGSVSMITKGGLNSATQNLAIEYAKDGIRFNAIAPGEVDTPMHSNDSCGKALPPTAQVTDGIRPKRAPAAHFGVC